MSRKAYFSIISLVLVSCLMWTTYTQAKDKPVILDNDPNLAGWWKLDETSGKTAADSSKHNRKGTLMEGLSFEKDSTFGKVSKALKFDGDGFVEIAGGSGAGYLSVFENVSDDSFHMVWQEPFGHPNVNIHKYLGDTDNNGFSEWLSGSHDFSHGGFFFKVFEAISDNQYETIYYDSLPGNPWFLGGADAGDVDGDGINEFVFSSNANVGLYKNSNLTGWERVWLLDGIPGSTRSYLVDVSGDSLCEIVISSEELPGFTYIYRLVPTRIDVVNTEYDNNINIFPNPFNDRVLINISVQSNRHINLDIFNITGQKILSRNGLSSYSKLTWNLEDDNKRRVGSGIYFIKISNHDFEHVKKVTILK